MFLRRRKKTEVPELNTTSTADISFMLLIFFLVSTSMEDDNGLSRRMAPYSPNVEIVATNVNARNVYNIEVHEGDSVTCRDKVVSLNELRARVKRFVMNPKHDPELSESVDKHIISVKCDSLATYEQYFKVENEIVLAYNELWDERAKQLYNIKYSECSPERQENIRKQIPQRISEL